MDNIYNQIKVESKTNVKEKEKKTEKYKKICWFERFVEQEISWKILKQEASRRT